MKFEETFTKTFILLLNITRMADLDQDFEDDVSYTESEDLDTNSEITYEQAMEWKKKAERLEKAERKLVELKKASKDKPEATEWITQKELDLREEVSDFILGNPDLKEYKADLLKYVKDWFTLRQAKALVENDDKAIANKEKANQLNISNWESWSTKTSYTESELEKMSQSDYEKAMGRIEKWEAKFKR